MSNRDNLEEIPQETDTSLHQTSEQDDPMVSHNPVAEDGESEPLVGELNETRKERDNFKSIAQRAQADLINYRARALDEKNEAVKNTTIELLMKILSVVDDLERAINLIPDEAVPQGWIEGLELVQRNLSSILNSEGVKRLDSLNNIFDPRQHEALSYQESEEFDEDIVVEVFREGYELNGKIIRAAQVIVSKSINQENQGI